jgi:hypothetical protein
MLEGIRRLWKANQWDVGFSASASVYADEAKVVLAKEKLWAPGPIYIRDLPWQRFGLDDLTGIQAFLIDVLTTPTKKERGDCPENISTEEFLRPLKVGSLQQAVVQYRFARVEVADGILLATSYKRNFNTKSWSETQKSVRETMWRRETLGANALLEALRNSE